MGLVNSGMRVENDDKDHFVHFGSATKDVNGRILNDIICRKDDEFAD